MLTSYQTYLGDQCFIGRLPATLWSSYYPACLALLSVYKSPLQDTTHRQKSMATLHPTLFEPVPPAIRAAESGMVLEGPSWTTVLTELR